MILKTPIHHGKTLLHYDLFLTLSLTRVTSLKTVSKILDVLESDSLGTYCKLEQPTLLTPTWLDALENTPPVLLANPQKQIKIFRKSFLCNQGWQASGTWCDPWTGCSKRREVSSQDKSRCSLDKMYLWDKSHLLPKE